MQALIADLQAVGLGLMGSWAEGEKEGSVALQSTATTSVDSSIVVG